MSEPRSRTWLVAAALVLVLAAFLRLYQLEARPPHHDEGVNGWMAENVVREGYYRYDPTNYHGPSYFYALAASREVFGFGLWQLRLPGALAGIALCMLPLLLRRRLGTTPALGACALLAVSPSLVFYARYAIHETWLAALCMAAGVSVLRWADGGRPRWILAAATAMALAIATKETTIIFLGVSGAWLAGEIAVASIRERAFVVLGRAVTWSWRIPVLAAAVVALVAAVHVLLFTGFLQQPGSMTEQLERSLRAYFVWSDRGTAHTGHAKDACYYVHLGIRYELALYVLAAVGLVSGFRSLWIRGPGIVGFGMFAAYSLVAYKMPWLPIGWLVLLAVPAGQGIVVLGRVLADELSRRAGARTALVLALMPALAITARSSFERPGDRRESLAYVHTDADFRRWYGHIQAGARVLGRDRVVVAIDHPAVWPMPWVLAPFPLTRWAAHGDEDVMVVGKSRTAAVERRLSHRYLRREYRVRDGAEPAWVYLRASLFERLVDARRFDTVGDDPIVAAIVR